MCSFPALSLQPAEPLRLRVWSVCGAWHGQGTTQWTWKAMQTPRHSLCLSLTHALIHNALVLLCLSLMYAPFCPKKGLETQKLTIRTPQLPPTPHSFSALRIQFISIMEKRKSASTRIVCGTSTNSPPSFFFFFCWRCQPDCLSDKIHAGTTFEEEEEEERSCLNNESVLGMNFSLGVSLDLFFFKVRLFFLQAVTMGSAPVRDSLKCPS